MCSFRRCAFVLPIVAVLATVLTSLFSDGKFWDHFPAWEISEMPSLDGKVAIVTGPTIGGIGHESAIELARKGANVILAGRNKVKGDAAVAALKKELPGATAEFMELDLSSLKSVKAFAGNFKGKHKKLHMLLNNAGVMANPFSLTVDGLESQFATNHLGHFLLTKLLMPELEAAAPSRIVTTSSAAAVFGGALASAPSSIFDGSSIIDFEHLGKDYEPSYNQFQAYCRSKLANVLFSKALDRRLAGKKVYSNSCNPGGIKTNLQVHAKKDMSEFGGQFFDQFLDTLGLPLKRGALTQLYLATSPDVEKQEIRGRFYQPQALQRGEPMLSDNEELQEKLWAVSERLVAEYV